ncbi:Extracellular lipase precursor [Grimontia hollisae]|uniref:Extracellular lipase n=2 Tax=Grimontia hollisae TaxID=673 RepID=A0A377HQK1_GRIHO|nr:Extracellular lipase precursor [Grimontia hollisae]STO58012.1 Extracellular lipase precursor [Grimontia hollisae]
MNKGLMMNKKTVVLALAPVFGLVACGGESSLSGGESQRAFEGYIQDSLQAPTQVHFQLAGADANIPGPSFILMNQTDGTLDIPTGGDNALSNPAAAMGTMDGWPVSMPLILSFKGAGLADGFPTSGISIIKLTKKLTEENPSIEKVLSLGSDYIVKTDSASDTALVIFTKPLEASSEYAFAITDSFTDVNGNSVGMTRSYATLVSRSNPTPVDTLKPASAVTQGVNSIFSALGVQPEDIVYSSWFSTQSVGDTLYATKAAIAQGAGAGNFNVVWKGSANPNNVDMSQAYLMSVPASGQDYAAAIQSDPNFATYIDPNGTATPLLVGSYTADSVTVTKGTVKLPYFLEKDVSSWNNTPFESGMPSLAVISSALNDSRHAGTVAQQLVEAGIDVSTLADNISEQLKLVGLTLADSTGEQLDAERIITRYSPIPQVKSLDDVPFILFTPTTPTGAMELVIYQHGITSAKENAYAFAANLINGAKGLGKNLAILAIDQPIHGERSLDSTRSANVDATNYLNLAYLPVGRDNLRQSVLDNLGLRAAVTLSQGSGLFSGTPLALLDDTTAQKPSLFGHSLGGITGFGTIVTANNTLSSADTDNSSADALFTFSRIAAANTGGQIVNLLIGSDTFGPLIRDTVTAGVPQAEQANILNQFAYAAQTVLDTVDPFNLINLNDFTETNVLSGLPIYMQQVKNDNTVPNAVESAPFAGTLPLATALDLTVVDGDSQATSNGRNVTKFNEVGQHSSVIAPQNGNLSDVNHTVEMQSQLVQFLSGAMEDFTVADTSVLE